MTEAEDHEYSYIDGAGVVREDSHRYEGLTGYKPRPAQMTLPERDKAPNKCCRKPPCWGWVLMVIGLVIVAILIALLVYFLTSTPRHDAVQTSIIAPAATDLTFTDCEDVYKKGHHETGVYEISPTGLRKMTVQCEQQLDGGGWTVFQRRINGYVSFDRNWAEYKNGFGAATAEYWLGNDNIHALTSGRGQKLKIEMTHPNTTRAYADFWMFWIDGEDEKYTLHVAGWTPSYPPGDGLSEHNGQGFSTSDQDNDGYDDENCGLYVKGGWWFNNCHPSNLNGKYEQGVAWDGVVWVPFTEPKESLLNVRMMVKER